MLSARPGIIFPKMWAHRSHAHNTLLLKELGGAGEVLHDLPAGFLRCRQEDSTLRHIYIYSRVPVTATVRKGIPKNGIMQLTEILGKTFFCLFFDRQAAFSTSHVGFENVYQMSKYLSELDSSVQPPSLSSKEKQFFFLVE